MKFQQWNLSPVSADDVTRLMDAGYPYLVSCVLASRGISDPAAASEFLVCDHRLTHSPLLMADMDKAVEAFPGPYPTARRSPCTATTTWTASPPL